MRVPNGLALLLRALRSPVLTIVLTGLLLALGACSASDAGLSGLSLNGLGADAAPKGAPTLKGSDPGGTYAFVYANQIWIKGSHDQAPHQLTHLPIIPGLTTLWGPLVWSPDRSEIAFVLVQAPGGASAPSAGPVYVASTSDGTVQVTAGTSVLRGHGYAWFGNNALFYANGSGISFYDLSDPSNPRPYRAIAAGDGPDYSSSGDPHYIMYADIAFQGSTLYATRLDITTLGGTGVVGRAKIWQYQMPVAPQDYAGGSMYISSGRLYGYPVVNLGQAYADQQGHILSGSWALASDGGIVFDQITAVDTKIGTYSGSICYGYAIGGCDQQVFQQVSTVPLSAHVDFAFSADDQKIAMTGAALSVVRRNGSNFAKLATGLWGSSPQWSPGGDAVFATEIGASASVVTFAGGKSNVYIAGALGLSWAPQA